MIDALWRIYALRLFAKRTRITSRWVPARILRPFTLWRYVSAQYSTWTGGFFLQHRVCLWQQKWLQQASAKFSSRISTLVIPFANNGALVCNTMHGLGDAKRPPKGFKRRPGDIRLLSLKRNWRRRRQYRQQHHNAFHCAPSLGTLFRTAFAGRLVKVKKMLSIKGYSGPSSITWLTVPFSCSRSPLPLSPTEERGGLHQLGNSKNTQKHTMQSHLIIF